MHNERKVVNFRVWADGSVSQWDGQQQRPWDREEKWGFSLNLLNSSHLGDSQVGMSPSRALNIQLDCKWWTTPGQKICKSWGSHATVTVFQYGFEWICTEVHHVKINPPHSEVHSTLCSLYHLIIHTPQPLPAAQGARFINSMEPTWRDIYLQGHMALSTHLGRNPGPMALNPTSFHFSIPGLWPLTPWHTGLWKGQWGLQVASQVTLTAKCMGMSSLSTAWGKCWEL